MLKSYEGMGEQLINGSYRPMLFTIYNMADDEGYIRRLHNMGLDVSIDDLEFLTFDIEKELMNQIKKGDRRTIAHAFKTYIEEDLQHNRSLIEIMISKEFGKVFAIKPKEYTIDDFLGGMEK